MVDMLEFTRNENGMEEEYNKVIRGEINIIVACGRTKISLDNRYKELQKRRERFLNEIQSMMIKLTLDERALAEISNNWNNKEYWNE